MARKKSSLAGINLDLIKEEVANNINHISKADIANIDDEIDFVVTQTGGSVPRVTASIEQKMSSYVVLVKGSIDQIKYIVEVEQQVTEDSEQLLTKFKGLLKTIKDYYQEHSQDTIKNREHKITRTSSKGKAYEITVLAANVPTQVVSRNKNMDIILKSQIIVDQIEYMKTDVSSKGGGGIPASLKHLF